VAKKRDGILGTEPQDKGNYTVSGGRIVASPGYSNDDGFGTPPMPGERGEAYGRPVPDGLGKAPGKANVIERFRKKGK
jgi:hypothetical protein